MTSGWEALEAQLRGLDAAELVRRSGVAQEVIERVADAYARSCATIFAWAMGITTTCTGWTTCACPSTSR